VTWFTRSSVVWAERMVATSSWKTVWKSSAHSSLAEPGYSVASRAIVSRARPLGVLGIPTKKDVMPTREWGMLATS